MQSTLTVNLTVNMETSKIIWKIKSMASFSNLKAEEQKSYPSPSSKENFVFWTWGKTEISWTHGEHAPGSWPLAWPV